MGNISSGKGNNFIENGNIQTPLNKFIEKVMNEEYFFSPNLNDNMINNLDKNDINNQHVLLKRALCTGRSFIPISLPFADCNQQTGENCIEGKYTINIRVRGLNGQPLPDIKDIDYATELNKYNQFLRITGTPIGNETQQQATERERKDYLDENPNVKVLKEYLELAKELKHRDNTADASAPPLTYGISTTTGEHSSARAGNTKGCKLFYQGSTNDINYKVSNTPGYNSFNEVTGESTSTAFCGKVLQYNEDETKNDKIGRKTTRRNETGNGNRYRNDEFEDCACLNSAMAIKHQEIKEIQREAQRLAEENGVNLAGVSGGEELSADVIAQHNDRYCKRRLSQFGSEGKAPAAYAPVDVLTNRDLKICNITSLLQGIDQTGGDFEAGANCGFTPDQEEKIRTCLKFPNKPECRGRSKPDDPPEESNDKDDSSNTILIVLVIVGIIAVVVGLYYYFVYRKKANTDIDTSGSTAGSTSSVPSNTKYTKPLSDPLFRL